MRLLEFAQWGWTDFVIASQPCATWGKARFLANGLGPLRFRGAEEAGRNDLTQAERACVDEAKLLPFQRLRLGRGGRQRKRRIPS